MDPIYMGFILLWPGSRIPDDYLPCQGQSLSVNQYQTLFTLLGTTYGGDGVNTFNLPDLRSRVPVGMGQGLSLTNRPLASFGGVENVTITPSTMPTHAHAIQSITLSSGTLSASLAAPLEITATVPVNASSGSSTTPSLGLSFAPAADTTGYGYPDNIYGPPDPNASGIPVNVSIPGYSENMSDLSVNLNGVSDLQGYSLPHENRQMYVAMNYIICINGLFPPQPNNIE